MIFKALLLCWELGLVSLCMSPLRAAPSSPQPHRSCGYTPSRSSKPQVLGLVSSTAVPNVAYGFSFSGRSSGSEFPLNCESLCGGGVYGDRLSFLLVSMCFPFCLITVKGLLHQCLESLPHQEIVPYVAIDSIVFTGRREFMIFSPETKCVYSDIGSCSVLCLLSCGLEQTTKLAGLHFAYSQN